MNIVQFPHEVRLSDIAAMARKFADDFEAGKYGDHPTAILILDGEESMQVFNWGDPVTMHECIGIYETAKAQVLDVLLHGGDE